MRLDLQWLWLVGGGGGVSDTHEGLPKSGRCTGSDLPHPSYCPIQIHTFWVDTKNYVEVTRKWYAEAIPFPLNFFLPGRMQRQFMERLQLLCGEHSPENEEELEKEVPLGQGAL